MIRIVGIFWICYKGKIFVVLIIGMKGNDGFFNDVGCLFISDGIVVSMKDFSREII